jgi:ubiquitin carboxyl-terminal hydrolase 14
MNTTRKLTIKWNKEQIPIEITASLVKELKDEIGRITNVEPFRQKLLFKGKNLDDSFQISAIPENSVLTLMGTASTETINIDAEKKIKFLEDLSNEEKAKIMKEKGEEPIYGLTNLGNTCYLNSTIQCLGRVPELRQALMKSISRSGQTGNNFNNITNNFVMTLGTVFQNLENKGDTVTPNQLVALLRSINPMFAEADKGNYKQQDAEECWSLILNIIRDYLPNDTQGEKFSNYLIDELFGLELTVQLKNIEEPSEFRQKKEIVYKLPCFIDSQTTELVTGLKTSLKENVDLNSEIFGRNCVFEKSQLISRLPPYLNINFIRFFWKQGNTETGAKAGKSKILKSVIFSKIIDLYELCDEGTKEILNIGRGIETKMLKEDRNFKIENVSNPGNKEMIPTGRYQLIAVLTHQGRSSDAGHYIAWTNKKDDKWVKYDDETTTVVNFTDVLELKGGGDWHMAYICVYKRMEIPFSEI